MGERKNLLIAGDDLKFIRPLFPYLENKFKIRIDRWNGPEGHDRDRSLSLLEWADIIHCEWLLGNTVWYSWNKLPQQKLTTRLHFFELGREYGRLLKHDAVDSYITVSRPMLERAISEFSLPRNKVKSIPNGIVKPDNLTVDHGHERMKSLAMVGAIPARKGLHRNLRILHELKKYDASFTLAIYGPTPSQVDWVWTDDYQREYFENCATQIEKTGLKSSVSWRGWCEMTEEYPKIGFVLSMSDEESFHVALVEGAFNGAAPLTLPWEGAHWTHPDFVIKPGTDEIVKTILKLQDKEEHRKHVEAACSAYQHYEAPFVANKLIDLWLQ
ncbi:hypothetical protein BK816_00435 [Boudabousia tangfeifanii]|uniref:Glycosyl transferase family 1 domain-containing protein n=1 Tax=Boudabousia tangfeifanii TaxID=1912795 RepID=A0A1D9MI44_9ACTO|nr:glycosyltransferase family 1 protein [Boudabousia tangfeifanii]AOZ71946.1 hypothetical protein BK816_00435 [Boudabousia tangfeifanii]